MIDFYSFRKRSYYSNFERRNSDVLELMESTFGPVPINPLHFEPSFNILNSPRFNVISNTNFTVNSPPVPCIFSSFNIKPTGVLKLLCDHPNLTWEHENNSHSRPLTSITKGPEFAGTRNFTNSVRADMDFRHFLSPCCFSDQVVASCMGLLIKGPMFTFAHMEIGGGASFTLLNKGIKFWCAST